MHRLFLALIVMVPSLALATEWQSGPTRVDVIELYTSEGCSSCPAADQWLSQLKDDPDLFSEFIPMAFHVDYWDYIGWKDRFAQPAFSARQRNYVREGLVSQPYTPGFVINSAEWRDWFRGNRQWHNSQEKVGELRTTVESGKLTAEFSGEGAGQLHVAVLGMGLSNQVKAGENRGRKLSHDFVVLETTSAPGHRQWEIALPPIPDRGQSRTAIVAWVTPLQSQSIIQATGGYLD